MSPSPLSCRNIPKPTAPASELRRAKGFTLIELIVAMALGLLLLGIAVTLLDQSKMPPTWRVPQRASTRTFAWR